MKRWDDFISELDKEAEDFLSRSVESVTESVYHHFGFNYNPFDVLLPLKNPDVYVPNTEVFKWFVKNILLQVKMLSANVNDATSRMASPENYLLVGASGQGKSTFLYMLALALDKLEAMKKMGKILTILVPIRAWQVETDEISQELKQQVETSTETILVATSLDELESIISTHEESVDVWLLFVDDVHLALKVENNVPPLNALASLFFKPFLMIGALPLGFYMYMIDFHHEIIKSSFKHQFRYFIDFFTGFSVLLPPLDERQMDLLLESRFSLKKTIPEVVSSSVRSLVSKLSLGNPRLALELLFRSFLISRRLERVIIKDDVVDAALHQLGLTKIKTIHELLSKSTESIGNELKPLLGKRILLLEILIYNSYLSEAASTSQESSEQWARHIARLLKISPSTLSYHMKTLMEFSERNFPLVKERVDPRDHRAKIITVNDNILPVIEFLLFMLKRQEKSGSILAEETTGEPLMVLPPLSAARNSRLF